MSDFKTHIEKVLEEKVQPMVGQHNGFVELIDADEATGVVTIRLAGSCKGCPLSAITLQWGIEKAFREVPGFRSVVTAEESPAD